MPDPAALATAYLEALVARDFAAVEALLADGFRLRELAPPGFEEWDRAGALDELRVFYGRFVDVVLLESDVWQVGAATYLRARLRLDDPGVGIRVLEEHHMLRCEDGLIASIDELCSGLHPLEEAAGE